MTQGQCPGIPMNWMWWKDEKLEKQQGQFHTIEWGQFASMINLKMERCGYCHKELDKAALKYALKIPEEHLLAKMEWICGECQQIEMEGADIDTREDDLKSQWMEEKYGYLRDEQ